MDSNGKPLAWKRPPGSGRGPVFYGSLFLLLLVIIHFVSHLTLYRNAFILGLHYGSYAVDDSPYAPKALIKGGPSQALPYSGKSLDAGAARAASRLADQYGKSALLVWYDGAIQLRHYSPGVAPQRRTESGAMAKPVVALAAGAAIADGYIANVYDPIRRYLKEYGTEAEGRVTILQLLEQSSGFAKHPRSWWPGSIGAKMYLDGDLLPLIRRHLLEHNPGRRFEDNDINAQLLLLATERAVQEPFADFLSSHLWKPIGASGGALWLDRKNGMARGFCCVFATAEDWLRLGLLVLNGGRAGDRQIVGEDFIAAMTTPAAQSPDDGWQVRLGTVFEKPSKMQSAPFLVHDLVYFAGEGGQRVYISKALGLVVVRVGARVSDFDEALLINSVIRGLKNKPPGALPELTGAWVPSR